MSEENNPAIREDTGRNEDGTFKKGVSGNPSGRPKGTLKDYVRQKFMAMTEEEKEEFLSKISPDTIWKMGEGMPKQDTEHSGEIKIVKPIYGNKSVQGHISDSKDIQPEQENQSSSGGNISE